MKMSQSGTCHPFSIVDIHRHHHIHDYHREKDVFIAQKEHFFAPKKHIFAPKVYQSTPAEDFSPNVCRDNFPAFLF